MRKLALALVITAACGGSKDSPKDGAPGDGAADAPADATVLPACANPVNGTNVSAQLVATAGDSVMLATSPPGDPRLFLVERGGAIEIFTAGAILPTPFLDVGNIIASSTGQGEQGLLGMAFHPQYATNGLFFIYYTLNTADVVARCSVSTGDPNVANATCTPILSVPDFASNHNGGMIEFGADNFLYIGIGDGGGGGDPQRTAQNNNNLLGKILRIDVDNPSGGKEYGIPSDNPFGNEVYAKGLRNPWRWSFDRMTGDMWIGDVGQGQLEEIDVVKAGELSGKNFGWSVYEGTSCCMTQPGGTGCAQASGTQAACNSVSGLTAPLYEHNHSAGWNAIVGGQVYRGTCFPDINGWYFFSDNGGRVVVRAILQANGTLDTMELPGTWPAGPASIHADASGELYETTVSGKVYHLVAAP